MATEALNRASFRKKEEFTLPKGAKVLYKDISIRVEEIENGFLVSKEINVKFEVNKMTDYRYYTKKYYSQENPLTIDLKDVGGKKLADNF